VLVAHHLPKCGAHLVTAKPRRACSRWGAQLFQMEGRDARSTQ
jgi:hypothetical protein